MGLSQVEKNRFKSWTLLKDYGKGATHLMHEMQMTKSVDGFSLFYSFPKCPECRELRDLDPAQNTVEDLMLRIGYQEGVGNNMGVCLFTAEGMPLTDDPFFNTWSLHDRHVEKESHLYVIFTPKENLPPLQPAQPVTEPSGMDTVRCHVMLRRIKQVGGFQNVVAYIRRLTGCHALAQILYQLMCRNEIGTKVQKGVSVDITRM
ncbi:uncharacterized protein LOC125295303 [Alosa alosa]|uniref:uncharacterized protein LOC125295303 n=1 Tax=Alosa alosa TaxID=278164 RepID=UPI0020150C85|nr:uncharacterized protein LOC125295303 [Alosa alosa]